MCSCHATGIVENYTAFDYPFDRIKRLYDINVHGAFFTAREAARNMIPGGGGSIVLVSSMSANVSTYFMRCSATLPLDLASLSNCQEWFYVSISRPKAQLSISCDLILGTFPIYNLVSQHCWLCPSPMLTASFPDCQHPTTANSLQRFQSRLVVFSTDQVATSPISKLFSPQLSSTWLHHWP